MTADNYLELLKTLVTSPSCPHVVLLLSAPAILRLFPDVFPPHIQAYIGDFDYKPIRNAALQVLGVPTPIEGERSS